MHSSTSRIQGSRRGNKKNRKHVWPREYGMQNKSTSENYVRWHGYPREHQLLGLSVNVPVEHDLIHANKQAALKSPLRTVLING